jgi:membrane protein involved in D-alanine export
MAVGLSKLLGIEIPENFNMPFIARNPQDFWSRWHISLSKWLYEYIFAPIYVKLMRLFSNSSKIILSSIAIFLTFSFSGVWHGLESRYLREGTLHASALFVFLNFDGYMRKYRPSLRKKMRDSRLVRVISTTITFHYVLLSFMLFSLDFTKIAFVFRKIFRVI